MYHFENSVRLEVRIYLLALSHFFEEKNVQYGNGVTYVQLDLYINP